MYIELIINGRLKKLWHYPDPQPPFTDQHSSEERTKVWDKMIMECRIDAAGKFNDDYESVEFYPLVRSRLSAKDISDEEYDAFLRLITDKKVDKVVSKNKPTLKNGKLI